MLFGQHSLNFKAKTVFQFVCENCIVLLYEFLCVLYFDDIIKMTFQVSAQLQQCPI